MYRLILVRMDMYVVATGAKEMSQRYRESPHVRTGSKPWRAIIQDNSKHTPVVGDPTWGKRERIC